MARPGVLVLLTVLLALSLAGCLGAPKAPVPNPEPVSPAGTGSDGSAPPAKANGTNLPPRAAFTWTPLDPEAGMPIFFIDQSTDPDDGVGGRVWAFPDGVTSQFGRPNHTFLEPGRYIVKLVVSDKAGQTDTASNTVVVRPAGSPPRVPTGPTPHVVVAVVDTGINPYHEVYRSVNAPDPPAAALDGYPPDAVPLSLTLGSDYGADRKADENVWKTAKLGQLYWIPGTRIVGAISFGHDTFGNAAPNNIPILDEDGHGTATSSRVALTAPDAWIVMVEAGGSSLDQAISWAANQSWIDIISVSIGPVGNAPVDYPAFRFGGYKIPTQAAWDAGKLVFTAAGNEPTLSITASTSGPPWVISVGGVLASGKGDPATAAKGMDLVSDYAPTTADSNSVSGTAPRDGTSFSAPSAAGAVAEALFTLRANLAWTHGIVGGKLMATPGPGLLADGLTNQELRLAMNGSARYWDLTEWKAATGVPILPTAPWLQMGWGYLDGNDSAALAQAILTGNVPAKPDEAVTYQDAVLQARAAMWG